MRPLSAPASRVALCLLLAAGFSAPARAKDEKKTVSEPVSSWLVAAPHTLRLPAFAGATTHGVKVADLLGQPGLEHARIDARVGETIVWADGDRSTFEERSVDDGALVLAEGKTDAAEIAIVAVYLEARRFEKAKLVLETEGLARVLLDGKQIGERTTAAKEKDDASRELEAELVLATGKHRLLVVLVRDASVESWSLSARIKRDEKSAKTPLEATIAPDRPLSLDDLLGARAIASISPSADGSWVAVRLREPDSSADDRDGWFEIRRASDGAIVRTLRGDSVYSSLAWAPRGRRFSYVTRRGETSTLWVADLDAGTADPVVTGIAKLGSHTWTPDARSIVYSVTTPYERKPDEKTGAIRMRGLADRWRTHRDISHLWQASLADGTRRRLTAGEHTTILHDIRGDSSRLVFSTRAMQYETRPYSVTRVWELDLESLDARQLLEGPWIGSSAYNPTGDKLVVLGGPNAFGDVGRNVPKGRIANDYDGQAYIVDVASGDARAITRDFDPSVEQAEWSTVDGKIYLRAENGSRVELFRHDPTGDAFETLASDVEAVSRFALASDAPLLVYHGTSADRPTRAFVLDLDERKSTLLVDPNRERYASIRLGEVEPFDFRARDGTTIHGRVHFPPDFDPKRRYPAIVYYYGGTSPTSRSFGGRYPKNLWAAHGYLVYVLQPSGATGFGQEFASRHVNNWGKTVVPEIIQGLDAFLKKHRYVDPKRIGCIGASYGGFMTMLLITHTEKFGAAVSHAGISSISSYWGEGWWGYLYSAVATAESFPWNRPELYIDQSALFRADKVATPLLLLHGTSDTNVPPGESEQMYTALKLLEKEVEYVRFEGEDHWILQHDKRVIWANTILAWFDRELKDQPEHWDHLYGE